MHPEIKTELHNGKTGLMTSYPWGLFIRKGSRVLCPDGKVRSLAYLAQSADTFFSIPASVRINGKNVTGYVTTEEQSYHDGKKTGPYLVATVFRPHTAEVENGLCPAWPNKLNEPEKFNSLIALAH